MKALLLDLDDTLLGNPMGTFLPRYMPLLGEHIAQISNLPPAGLINAVFRATRVMTGNTDPAITNADLFWQEMKKSTDIDWLALNAPGHMEDFYNGRFHDLKEITTVRPAARRLVEWAIDRNLDVVVATNPLFPRAAIEARLTWAEIGHYPFKLVTTMENMHATKPTRAYYEEILQKIGRAPAEAIMVGDDWKNDIEPAAALGMKNFWITEGGESTPQDNLTNGKGDLEACFAWLKGVYDLR